MDWMLFESRNERVVAEADRQERLYGLAYRRAQRGQVERAGRLYANFWDRRLHVAHPDVLLIMLDFHRYPMAMMQAGRPAAAVRFLRALVIIRNRRLAWDDDQPGLLQALQDWYGCLTTIGDQRSALEAAALVDSVKRTIESRAPEARR